MIEWYLLAKGYTTSRTRTTLVRDMIRNAPRDSSFYKDLAKIVRGSIPESLGDSVRRVETHNKVPSVLRVQLARLIAGQTVSPTFSANYMALGTDNTAPTDTDTTLGAEVLRGAFTQRSSIEHTAYLDKFFSSAEVGGLTFLEAGIFVDGTGAVDSGFLLSRTNVNLSLSPTETLSVNASITISSAT